MGGRKEKRLNQARTRTGAVCFLSRVASRWENVYIYVEEESTDETMWPGEWCLQGKWGKQERVVLGEKERHCMLSLIPEL